MVYQALHSSLKVVDNFYCYIWQGRGNNCNSCLFVNVLRGSRPHVIIDPGHIVNEFREPCFNSLVGAMGKDGFAIEDVGLIINTHSHPDHCQANEVIIRRERRKEGMDREVPIALSREEEEFLKDTGGRLYTAFGVKPPQFLPLFYLTEGTLSLGTENKVNFQVLKTPGHSPGSICFYILESKILLTGDVIFFGSVGRTDLPGGSLSQLKESIERLSKLDVEYLVPGHTTEFGSIIKGKANVERNFQAVKLFF